ncbi:DUF1801 domain-containing protein [Agromyces sp. S2-1-8]|uniref:DUF1801 domain-containing protein n=1 Tax=Agromyces sp. S2-1-8 TaxID=2897180 RepID=UPI001E416C82|nr:DUF1801 domain-containing protein [Agromyces sp. S2-1-8]MCD5345841.1 DUF1801 domain-containing protein [Agromyces sp. S2-1-8]
MATGRTDVPVEVFLDSVTHRVRRRDADTLLALMQRVTGEEAYMWGPSIVGFGEYRYRYDSGREGVTPAAAFSPRKAASTVYLLPGFAEDSELLERLGPHTTGVGCLYLKDLAVVDLDMLTDLVRESYDFAVRSAG